MYSLGRLARFICSENFTNGNPNQQQGERNQSGCLTSMVQRTETTLQHHHGCLRSTGGAASDRGKKTIATTEVGRVARKTRRNVWAKGTCGRGRGTAKSSRAYDQAREADEWAF
nr:unnamed protein product [Digitaria exilis]